MSGGQTKCRYYIRVFWFCRRRERLAFDTDLGLFAFFFGMSENGTTTNIDQRSYALSFFCLSHISDAY